MEEVIEHAGKSNRILQVIGIIMAAFSAVHSWQVLFT